MSMHCQRLGCSRLTRSYYAFGTLGDKYCGPCATDKLRWVQRMFPGYFQVTESVNWDDAAMEVESERLDRFGIPRTISR